MCMCGLVTWLGVPFTCTGKVGCVSWLTFKASLLPYHSGLTSWSAQTPHFTAVSTGKKNLGHFRARGTLTGADSFRSFGERVVRALG